jgi:hypothetical protein
VAREIGQAQLRLEARAQDQGQGQGDYGPRGPILQQQVLGDHIPSGGINLRASGLRTVCVYHLPCCTSYSRDG